MEYKVGDKVVVMDGEKSYVVEITNRYKLYANGYAYDGIRLFDNEDIEFLQRNIECRIESGPCPCGPKGEEGVKKEEKKYLKTWEAIKALEEGEEGLIARRLDWLTMEYGSENYIYMNNGKLAINGMIGSNHILNDMDEAKWIIEEPKKEIPKEFEGLKYILGSINNMDCGEKDCDKCPLGIEKCDMLDEIFFDMKEKYNF